MKVLGMLAIFAVIFGAMWLVTITPDWVMALLSIVALLGIFVGIVKLVKVVLK